MENEKTPSETPTCPKCGSRHLMDNLPVGTHAASVEVQVVVVPATLMQPPRGLAAIRATVCGNCGYTELYTDGYARVWQAWRQHNA